MNASQKSGTLFIALCIVFTVVGQLLVKHGMTQLGKPPDDLRSMPMFFLRAVFTPSNLGGLLCAVLAAISWMAALARCDLSFAYPFMGLAIVLVMVLSARLFGEDVSPYQWAGVGLVSLGLWVTSGNSL